MLAHQLGYPLLCPLVQSHHRPFCEVDIYSFILDYGTGVVRLHALRIVYLLSLSAALFHIFLVQDPHGIDYYIGV